MKPYHFTSLGFVCFVIAAGWHGNPVITFGVAGFCLILGGAMWADMRRQEFERKKHEDDMELIRKYRPGTDGIEPFP